ncbi:hypothetical protein AQI95_20990 [Streptomyces yokosukanensis]|uniref:Uncharacterized protein n=1 Tax=Streptomyces yokosukanensis TaxID=67386 RepID=A0A101P2W6_9ACTN|nr:hypothetical protein AQI95_20990 [Streptomyces yokosukanensis]
MMPAALSFPVAAADSSGVRSTVAWVIIRQLPEGSSASSRATGSCAPSSSETKCSRAAAWASTIGSLSQWTTRASGAVRHAALRRRPTR